MKKSIIKYLVIFVIVIIIISFTGYNLDTEPHNINTISQSQLKNCTDHMGFYVLKYINLTYGNSKAEYLINFHYPAQAYHTHTEFIVGAINVYKLSIEQKFPLTGISLEIKNIKFENTSLIYRSTHTNVCNNTIEKNTCGRFTTAGNKSISVSFNIVPVYNMYIYHFNGKEQYFHYNYTLKVIR